MVEYIIEQRSGHDYVVSSERGLNFKVIPPEKQDDDLAYPAGMAVAAVFEDNRPDPKREDFVSDEDFENACYERSMDYGDGPRVDFLSLTVQFKDDDYSDSNKDLWLDAINYYCQVKLDKPVVDLSPHNYNYDAEY